MTADNTTPAAEQAPPPATTLSEEAEAQTPTGQSATAAAAETAATEASAPEQAVSNSESEGTTPEPAQQAPETQAQAASGSQDSAEPEAGEQVAHEESSEASEDKKPPEASEASTADAKAPAKKKRKRRRKKKPGTGADEGAARAAAERAPFHIGEEVFGLVTTVLPAAIMVDLAGKALAIFDRSEMEPDDLVPAPGDRFVASVLRDGSRGGLVVLTRKPLREEASKAAVREAHKAGAEVSGLVTGTIKGGVEVSLHGLRAFAPASGMDLHPQNANFTSLVGQTLNFKVSQCDEKARDVVVTRRPMLEAEAHERRKKALTLLKEGQVLKGVIRTIVEWGAFAAMPEAEGLEGLIHVSEASHDPKARIGDLFKMGQEVEVKITKIDERGKIWLSRKALIEDPWAEAKNKYQPGKTLEAKVSRVEPFGVFVKLDDDVEGLVHISDLMAAPQFGYKKVAHPNEVVSVDQTLSVVVHNFDTRTRKVSLHVNLPDEKKEEKPQRVARNAALETEVIRAESAGLIVRVLGVTGRSSRGFIPAGQTGTERGTDLKKKFKAGTSIRAKVIDLDPRRPEPKLSIKQLEQDEERRAHKEYRKKFVEDSKFGTLGDLLSKFR